MALWLLVLIYTLCLCRDRCLQQKIKTKLKNKMETKSSYKHDSHLSFSYIVNTLVVSTRTFNSWATELLAWLGIEDLDLILKERRLHWYGHVERSNGAVKTAFDIQINGLQTYRLMESMGLGGPRWLGSSWLRGIAESGSSQLSTLMIETPEDLVWDLRCVPQASCVEGGSLLWIWPLYLHVHKKSDDDDDDDDDPEHSNFYSLKVHPMKTQISLCFHTVWSVFMGCIKNH